MSVVSSTVVSGVAWKKAGDDGVDCCMRLMINEKRGRVFLEVLERAGTKNYIVFVLFSVVHFGMYTTLYTATTG